MGCALKDHIPVHLLTSSPSVSYPQMVLWPLGPAMHSWVQLYQSHPQIQICSYIGPSVGNALPLPLSPRNSSLQSQPKASELTVSPASPKCLT